MTNVLDAKPFHALPCPDGHFLFGNMAEMKEDFMQMLVNAAQNHGEIVRFRFLHQSAVLFTSPEAINHILIKNHRNYRKETRGYVAMRMLVGNGLVTSEGDFWLRQRRIAQPSFHRKRIAGFAEAMTSASDRMVKGWQSNVKDGEVIDIADEMMKLTLQIVGETLLSADLSGDSNEVSGALDVALHYVLDRIRLPLMTPAFVPTARNREMRRALATLNEIVTRIIRERREIERSGEEGEQPSDLLTMLLEARDEETGEGMNDAQLRDEVMTMFLAGHETTANAMTWTWHLLGQHPEVERKLHAELDEVLGDRLPGLEDLPRLPYTRMIIDESMRLYPPVPVVARLSVEPDVVCGYQIPAKAFVLMAPFVTHRHPDYWPDPERFDPERFADGKTSGLPRFAYFPFLGGPRQCIGNNFALMEAQLILATIASRYRLVPVPDHRVVPEVTITLRPEFGLKMTLEPRK